MLVRSIFLSLAILLCVTAAPVHASAIHQAALMGDLAKIRTLATKDPSVVNKRDENGLTPLFWCVYADQPEAASLLLDLNASIDATDNSRESALHVAVALGTTEMVRLLVSRGAELSLKDGNGCTPAMIAERLKKPDVLDALLGLKPAPVPDPVSDGTLLASASLETTGISLPAPRKAGAAGTKAVSHQSTTVLGIPVNVITVDLNDARVSISAAISQNGIGTDESFSSFIKRCMPTAAINGTFFSKTSLRPIGDIVIKGELAHWGGMGTALCFTDDCKPAIITVERHKRIDWSDYRTVIASGPRLLTEGKVTVDPAAEGFRDPHVLNKANRTGAGITSANKLVIANTSKSVSLTEWANIMRSLGCVDALNMDGGASMAMFYREKMITQASRKLTNVLLIYER